MKNKEIEIKIRLNEHDLKKIEDYVDIYNKDKYLENYFYDYGTVENFIVGAVINEIERLESINQVFCELKTRGYIRPIKLKNNFKEIIKTMGLKQYHIQEMTGISESDVSAIMNNRRLLSLDHFLRVWIALGCPDIDKVLYVEK